MISTISILILIFLLVGLWYSTMKSKELAVMTAKALCQQEQVLLLDDTVSVKKLWLARNESGRICFKRTYSFEYSLSNNQRYNGHIVIVGKTVTEKGLTISPTRFEDNTPDRNTDTSNTNDNILDFKPKDRNIH